MGDKQSQQTVDTGRPEDGHAGASEPADGTDADVAAEPGVIDLRSPAGDGSNAAPTSSGSPSSEEWRRDRAGWRLRMVTSPGHQVDVRLPRTFGPSDGHQVDLLEGDDDTTSALVQHLAVHALEPSGWPTALARAADLVEISRPTPVSRRAAVGEVLRIQLQDQYTELLANEGGVRAGVGESVHRMRVATRRLRSLLATYRPWLTGNRSERLRAELRFLAEDLGRARDNDVLHARLDQEIAVAAR